MSTPTADPMSQKARTMAALQNANDFVQKHDRKILSSVAMMCTIKATTLRTYASKLRSIAMFMNEIDEPNLVRSDMQRVPRDVLEQGEEYGLAQAVVNDMSGKGFEWFMGWRAENGLIGIPQFRSAMLKAQQIDYLAK